MKSQKINGKRFFKTQNSFGKAVWKSVTLFWAAGILGIGILGTFPTHLLADTLIIAESDASKLNSERSENGTISKITRSEVEIKDKAGIAQTFPANQIIVTQYASEPVQLQVARTAIDSSQYEDALKQLGTVTKEEIAKADEFVRQDYEFLRVYAAGQLALSGHPEFSLRSAGSQLNNFVKNNGESYHFYEANRMLGHILVAMEDFKNAPSYFTVLTEAPWEDMKIEGNIALGTILLNEKNRDLAKARQVFQEVLKINNDSPEVKVQKDFAQIGMGRIAALEGNLDEGVKIFNQLIESSNADATLLQARLYNALGDSYMEAGKNKDAILAFLHVDLLYSSASVEHIKALKNLIILWKKELREDRAAECQNILKTRYKIMD